MKAAFYILHSQTADRFYLGHTTEPIEERVRKHNSNHKGFTGKFQDWKLVYVEMLHSKSDAYRREMQVKSWKSKFKIAALIQSSLP